MPTRVYRRTAPSLASGLIDQWRNIPTRASPSQQPSNGTCRVRLALAARLAVLHLRNRVSQTPMPPCRWSETGQPQLGQSSKSSHS